MVGPGRLLSHRRVPRACAAGSGARPRGKGSGGWGRRCIGLSATTGSPGSSGIIVRLSTNHFRLTSRPQWALYQYHVDYNPLMEARRLRSALLFQHEDLIGRCHAFDGTILFLPKRLQHKVTFGVVLARGRCGFRVRAPAPQPGEALGGTAGAPVWWGLSRPPRARHRHWCVTFVPAPGAPWPPHGCTPVPTHASCPAALPWWSETPGARHCCPGSPGHGQPRSLWTVLSSPPPPGPGDGGVQSDAQRGACAGDRHAHERAPAHVTHLPAVLQHHLPEVRPRPRPAGGQGRGTGGGPQAGSPVFSLPIRVV